MAQPIAHENTWQYNGRFDQRISDADQLSIRYSYGNQDLFEPYTHDSSDIPGFGDYVANIGHNAMVHYQKAFGPQRLNSLRIGFNRSFRHVQPENYRVDVGKQWNVSWLNLRSRDFGYPQINIAWFSPVGDLGSAGRNILNGPGLFSFDIGTSRRFVLGEGVSLALDVEAFNLFNRANFDLPESYADEPRTFGKIFSSKAPRQIQFALRFAF